MIRRRDIIITVYAVVTAAPLVIAGMAVFSGGRHRAAAPEPPAAHAGLTSPFTGEPVKALGPVLAVKIDNIGQARPQTGLTDAARGPGLGRAGGPPVGLWPQGMVRYVTVSVTRGDAS